MQDNLKVLIATIHPTAGGVSSMLEFIIPCLQQRNYHVTLAYYRPYSVSPELSVPLHKILFKKPSMINEKLLNVDCAGIGCWAPEFEVTNYWATKQWKQLIGSHDVHLAVSGSCMAALPYLQMSTPFMGWVASDWQGDRLHRVKAFPWYRKLVDQLLITPLAKRIEANIINSNNLVALSKHTLNELNIRAVRSSVKHVLHMPIDTDCFRPKTNHKLQYQIGFIGRFEDPRKNIALLLKSIEKIKQQHPSIKLLLVGDVISTRTNRIIKELNIEDNVTAISYMPRDQLATFLEGLDVFVLPSRQEGLCIAVLEAMSCGVPIISTRCGGPESYIVDGVNGVLCEHNSDTIATKVLQLYADERLRMRYVNAGIETVTKTFSLGQQKTKFWSLFDAHLKTLKTVGTSKALTEYER